MDMPGFTSPSDNDENDATLSRADTVEIGAVLLSIAHALADYMLSDNAHITDLASMMGRTDPAQMREEIQDAHDAFAQMAARAATELFMTQLLSGALSLSDLGDDDDGPLPDLSVYGI